MHLKALLIGFIALLFSLSITACSDHGHDHGDPHGHSHESATQQQPELSPTTHDNID